MRRIFDEIDNKNIKAVRTLVDEELSQLVINDKEAINWVAQPANLKKLHTELTTKLGVPRNLLMLRNRVTSTHRRAVMFVKAISNGLKRVDIE